MKRILQLVVVALLILPGGKILAQDRTVTGRVTSADDGSSLPGVNVVLKGTTLGTNTDVDGRYSISIPSSGGTLVFSFIGLRSQEAEVGSRSVVDVSMQTDITQLSEVVVTGYATIEKRSVTGSISSVKGSVIENLPLQSFDRALQGRAAGVLVQSNNGIPGGAVNVRIRGTGSINASNDPLYIVDGVQLNNTNNAAYTQSNPLAFLNPNDIESIEVLKDAATAAIYGAQAANGVVLITTKKGKQGKARFNFNYYTGVSEPLKILNVLNSQEWYQLRKEAWANSGNTLPEANTLNNMGRLPANWQTLTTAELDQIAAELPTYDWQREAWRTGKVNNYELSMSGGDDKTTFYLSGSYVNQEAIISPVNFERGTLNVKLNHKANNKLTIENSLNLSMFQQNVPFATDGSFLGNPAFATSTILPHNPIYNEDGSFNTAIAGVLNQNPIAVVAWNSGTQRTNQVVGNINATYKILDNLSLKSLFGLDYRFVNGDRYTDPRTPDGAGVSGRASAQTNWNTNFITSHVLNYSNTFASKHDVNALLGYEYRSETNEQLNGAGIGFASYQFRTIQSAATPENIVSFWTGYRRMGTFGQLIYQYDKKYNLTLTGRYDGSSRFGSNNRYGFFPAVAASWLIKQENFMQNIDFVSELKVRASWGQTGNDAIGNFSSRGLYGAAGNYNNFGGIRPTGLPNDDLSWERNVTTNIGLDFGLFNNRVSVATDYFIRQSKDLLLDQPVLWTSGYGSITRNVGELENRGIELEIRTINVDQGDFKWTTDFNFTHITNKVTKLYGGLEELPGDPSVRVGYSLGTYYTYEFAGVNPSTGRPMWYDANGNPKYQVQLADRRVIGRRVNNQADFFGGMTNTLSYKGFEVSFFFQYEYGRVVADGQYGFLLENATRLTLNTLEETAGPRWTTPGQITHIPRPYNGGPEPRGSGPTTGTAGLQKTDYIRLKQVSLAYNFNQNLIRRAGLTNAKVYVQGVNLWTYDDYIGYDPEWFGSATGIIPQSKNYTFGIQLSF
ncbi:MAG: TonB-dependent receptor [Cyclobacteriaceae bacterium]|nr:TonB-dependent receptor [Cyclobacteriaceae bacterium]